MAGRSARDIRDDALLDEAIRGVQSPVFRYQSVEERRLGWLKTLLLDSRLYFPNYLSFNDPLDCRVTPVFKAPELVARQYWREAVVRLYPGVRLRDQKKRIDAFIAETRTPRGADQTAERIMASVAKHGIACFARNIRSTLMWSYYAAGHTGIAVRFEINLANLGTAGRLYQYIPIEVKYQNAFPEVNFYNDGMIARIMAIFGTKSSDWNHEEEWRLVNVNKVGYATIPRSMITGIVFGLRTPADVEAEIRGWVAARPVPTSLMRMTNRRGSFDLVVEDAT